MPLFIGPYCKNLQLPLIERFKKKLAGWKGETLSIVGKYFLVKIVIQSMHVYYASVFEIPIGICNHIDHICNQFLWKGMEGKRRVALVSWTKVCQQKRQGGLGIQSLQEFNKALRGKLAWKVSIREDRKWVNIYQQKYLRYGCNFIHDELVRKGSAFWKGIAKVRQLLKENVTWSISNGRDV